MKIVVIGARGKTIKAINSKQTTLNSKQFRFNAKKDILYTSNDLYKRLFHKTNEALERIARQLDTSAVTFAESIISRLLSHTKQQLSVELDTKKFKPSLYVEVPQIKNLTRYFYNIEKYLPLLHLKYKRISVEYLNRLLAIADLSSIPPLRLITAKSMTSSPHSALQTIEEECDLLSTGVSPYETASKYWDEEAESEDARKPKPSFEFKDRRLRHVIQNQCNKLFYATRSIKDNILASQKLCLVITARAGEGKTMFLNNLITNTFLTTSTPILYATGGRISNSKQPLNQYLSTILFHAPNMPIEAVVEKLQSVAELLSTVFVIAIDAINEHNDHILFESELQDLITASKPHNRLKIILTCREEYLASRFGQLIDQNSAVLLRQSLYQSRSHYFESTVLDRHLNHFKLQKVELSREVIHRLQESKFLLRVFCETYASIKEKPTQVASIRKLELFSNYTKYRIDDHIKRYRNANMHVDTLRRNTYKSLQSIAEEMIKTGSYSGIRITRLPDQYISNIDSLLDDEAFIRKDISNSSPHDNTFDMVCFSFDEIRDFFLVQYITSLEEEDAKQAAALIFAFKSERNYSPPNEGVLRFLFHAVRSTTLESLSTLIQSQESYESIFAQEVFDLPKNELTECDTNLLKHLLTQDGHQSVNICRRMAGRWNFHIYSSLNLSDLITFALDDASVCQNLQSAYRDPQEKFLDSVVSGLHKIYSQQEWERSDLELHTPLLQLAMISHRTPHRVLISRLLLTIWKREPQFVAGLFSQILQNASEPAADSARSLLGAMPPKFLDDYWART